MQCPVDGATLLLSERQTIEIDYCPQCRGVWLDRGELDKLISRNERNERDDDDRDDRDDRRDRDERRERSDWRDDDRGRAPGHAPGEYRPKKKKKFLSEMFDFD